MGPGFYEGMAGRVGGKAGVLDERCNKAMVDKVPVLGVAVLPQRRWIGGGLAAVKELAAGGEWRFPKGSVRRLF